MSKWLVDRATSALATRTDRRGFLTRSALAGTALAVAPASYVLRPGSAYAAICGCAGSSCDCASKCCDGYTEFCCTITGENKCPPGSVAAGWWKADAPGLCGDGPRYYVDCNVLLGYPVCSCGCANGNCNNRKACCTQFRYGQCHQEIRQVGPIMCRTVSCRPPWVTDPACTPASATDNATRFHDAACLHTAESGPTTLSRAEWYFRNTATTGVADTTISYGDPGDIPIVGDWDGDGVATPGVVRNGWWYLRNQPGGGAADIVFPYGDPGDIPVVGKWVAGDRRDLPGVIRGITWYLKTDHAGGSADIQFSYGRPGDVPIVGDWDGGGTDGPGVFRDGRWLLRNSLSSGVADIEFGFGDPGDVPVPGRWVANDQRDLPAVWRNATWYVRHDVAGGVADTTFAYGDPRDLPLVGDWNGDGVDGPGVAR